VKFGIDVLRDDHFKMLEGKRLGIVANPASVDANLVSTVTLLTQAKNLKVVSLFGPEHGIWGDEYAGESIKDRIDPHTGLPIYSVFGKSRKPTTRSILPIETLGVRPPGHRQPQLHVHLDAEDVHGSVRGFQHRDGRARPAQSRWAGSGSRGRCWSAGTNRSSGSSPCRTCTG
jgi:hypothetical protein